MTSRYPLWARAEDRGYVTGLRTDRREALVTTLVDGEPLNRYVLPSSSIWPFLAAVGFAIGLVGSVYAFSWYYVASVLGMIGLIGWFWPRRPLDLNP